MNVDLIQFQGSLWIVADNEKFTSKAAVKEKKYLFAGNEMIRK